MFWSASCCIRGGLAPLKATRIPNPHIPLGTRGLQYTLNLRALTPAFREALVPLVTFSKKALRKLRKESRPRAASLQRSTSQGAGTQHPIHFSCAPARCHTNSNPKVRKSGAVAKAVLASMVLEEEGPIRAARGEEDSRDIRRANHPAKGPAPPESIIFSVPVGFYVTK